MEWNPMPWHHYAEILIQLRSDNMALWRSRNNTDLQFKTIFPAIYVSVTYYSQASLYYGQILYWLAGTYVCGYVAWGIWALYPLILSSPWCVPFVAHIIILKLYSHVGISYRQHHRHHHRHRHSHHHRHHHYTKKLRRIEHSDSIQHCNYWDCI